MSSPPPPPPPEEPAAFQGSLGPEVFLEDINFTVRRDWFRTIAVSPHDPNVAYVGSFDGYVWKTDDGGMTWDESRLITEPKSFYGDSGELIYFGRHRTGDGSSVSLDEEISKTGGLTYGSGPSGEGSDSSDASSEGRGASANANFGIGVPGGAPRLQLLVRKFGKTTAGINIKQTLYSLGARPTEIRMLVVHPKNPDVVFACTAFGLYKTDDGGQNWVRTFTGVSKYGRFAAQVAVDPTDLRRVFLATGEGLYISEDGGDSFMKSTRKGVGEGWISQIYFYPYDARYIFAATDSGVLRSDDGGRSWDWIYYTTFPPARVVTWIASDPFERRRGYIATYDGVFMTSDLLEGGLESWQRLGGLQFTGVNVLKVSACPRHRGHLWAQTIMRMPSPTKSGSYDTGGAFILESLDSGESWDVIYSGNTNGSVQWYDNDTSDPDLLWIAWSRSLSRMRRLTPDMKRPERAQLPDDPEVSQVLQAMLRYTGTDPGVELAYRKRSLWRALIPRLSLEYYHWQWNDFLLLRDARFPGLPFYRNAGYDSSTDEYRVLLSWDLGDLVFNLSRTMFGRVSRINDEMRGYLTFYVHGMYTELRQLRFLLANTPPTSLRIRLMYKLRVEELTSYLNLMTGGYLERWKRGDRPEGRDTEWWEPWIEEYQTLRR